MNDIFNGKDDEFKVWFDISQSMIHVENALIK